MLRFVLVFLVLLNLHLFAQEKPELAAEKSTSDWLALVDADKYGESWDSAAEIFKSAITKEKWVESLTSVHNQTGKLKSRKLKSAQSTENLPNAPAGKYVVIQYDSSFEIGAAIETVVLTQEKDARGKYQVISSNQHSESVRLSSAVSALNSTELRLPARKN